MVATYTLYGGELSLFTRKLEAALRCYGADFRFVNKQSADAASIEARAGTHQVPVLQTPENWMLADTTPIIELLDGRFPARRLFPDGLLGVVVHVLEEHFDEWIARTMVHYRWHYPECAEFAAERMSLGRPEIRERMLAWGPRACRATGTDSPHQQEAAEAEYEAMLTAAEAQLQTTRFLLGDRPTALDCIVLGGLRAHTHMDPVPKRMVARYPTVVEWVERRADAWTGDGALLPLDESGFARHALAGMRDTYARFVVANREALDAGAKAFRCVMFGEEVSYLTRPYPEASRRMVGARIARLSQDDQAAVAKWLRHWGLPGVFD